MKLSALEKTSAVVEQSQNCWPPSSAWARTARWTPRLKTLSPWPGILHWLSALSRLPTDKLRPVCSLSWSRQWGGEFHHAVVTPHTSQPYSDETTLTVLIVYSDQVVCCVYSVHHDTLSVLLGYNQNKYYNMYNHRRNILIKKPLLFCIWSPKPSKLFCIISLIGRPRWLLIFALFTVKVVSGGGPSDRHKQIKWDIFSS